MLKANRKLFFRLHSWIGIKLSILFFIVCFSGTLATLSHEMDWLFFPDIRAVPQAELASRNLAVQNIKQAFPVGVIDYWAASKEPYLCDIVYVRYEGKRLYTFVNQYTGELQGYTTLTFQRFFRDLHYYLFIPFQVGHFMVLIFSFLLLISLITALYFYKKWYKKLFALTLDKGSTVFFRSLHRLVGVWSVPFILIFSITGIWYFLERANIGNVSDVANPKNPEMSYTGSGDTKIHDHIFTIDYDTAAILARKEISGLELKEFIPPSSLNDPLYLTGKSDVPLVRNRANRVYINPHTYEVLKVQKASELDIITYVNDIADPIHFGYWGGLVTKIIWFFFGLGISALILTGIWVSLKRKVKNQRRQTLGYWKYINWAVYIIMLGFMYYNVITNYHASTTALIVITSGWLVFLFLTWYLFVFHLKKSIAREKFKRTKDEKKRPSPVLNL